MKALVSSILEANQIYEEYEELHTSGLANRVYATKNYIIRIPTDHEEALNDSRTESVAAPAARAHGIRTPKLIRYDDSCTMLDRSYSIWERVHGAPLGRLNDKFSLMDTWVNVGRELGKLHMAINDCDDPNGWLDSPDREYSKKEMMEYFGNGDGCARKVFEYIEYAFTERTFSYDKRFVHGDMHDENIMCNENGGFSALIDWGDAGWADPAIDFYMLPAWATGWALKGYAAIAPGLVNENFLDRIILDKIWALVEEEKNDTEIYDGIERLKSDIEANVDLAKQANTALDSRGEI